MNELETLAVGLHAAATVVHGHGVVTGKLSPREQGAVTTLHILAIVHHLISQNPSDVAAHLCGIGAAFSSSRIAHLIAAGYDARATWKHAGRLLGVA